MHVQHPRTAAGACLVVCLAVMPMPLARETPAAAGCGLWLAPVDGEVTQPFRAPAFAYGPGHRGIDFAAPPGTPVRAAGDGQVVFAGSVAGSMHLVVAHDGNLRTTYAFLAGIAAPQGDHVTRGQVVGVAGGAGPEHEPGGLHFGVRLGDRYLDPQRFFDACDLTQLVRLVPADEPPAEPWDTHRVAAVGTLSSGGSGVGAVVGDLAGALGDAVGMAAGTGRAGWDAMAGAGGALGDGARALAGYGADVARRYAGAAGFAFAHSPLGVAASLGADIAAGAAEWWRHRQDCSDGSASADGTGGSGHLLMAVGGIDGAGAPDRPTFGLDTRALGYHDDEITYFSYSPDGGAYRAPDTRGDLHEAGGRLAEQLKQAQREHPGREVDLIAHSQGGVVVDVFVQDYYEAADPEYPPIGTIVTLSSPHEGVPLATAAADWRKSPVGRALLEAAEQRAPIPDTGAPSVRQLDEQSRFLRDLWDDRLPEHLDFTTIGATDDVVVPATQVDVPDASKVVVNVGGGPLDDHTNIPRDANALRAVRAALEGRAPPCVGVAEGVRGAVVPTLITRFEHALGGLPGVTG